MSWRATSVKGHKMWENSQGERSLDPFPDNNGISSRRTSSPIYIRSTSISAFITGILIGFGIGILFTIYVLG
jgi:F0F1-type ATP synthase assembly protein I